MSNTTPFGDMIRWLFLRSRETTLRISEDEPLEEEAIRREYEDNERLYREACRIINRMTSPEKLYDVGYVVATRLEKFGN